LFILNLPSKSNTNPNVFNYLRNLTFAVWSLIYGSEIEIDQIFDFITTIKDGGTAYN